MGRPPKRLRLDYFCNHSYYSTQPAFWENHDVLVYLASFCTDKELGVLCSLSNNHRFVFSLNSAWKHLPHDPTDKAVQIDGYLDYPPGWDGSWPPYALHLPEKTPVKYKRAYYMATKMGLRPSLSDSLNELGKRCRIFERDIKRANIKMETIRADMIWLSSQLERLGHPQHSYDMVQFEQWYHDHTYYMRKLFRSRVEMNRLNKAHAHYTRALSTLQSEHEALTGRWTKTQSFAAFLKWGVWSFYDMWDTEKTDYMGQALMYLYTPVLRAMTPNNKSITSEVTGDVDWRLTQFEECDAEPGTEQSHYPYKCGPWCRNKDHVAKVSPW